MEAAMPTLKRAVSAFLGAVPARHHVTLLGFNGEVFTLTRQTTDPAERMKAVARLVPWGTTALYDAILEGADMLGPQTGRKALVVFTDGEDRGSHATVADVAQTLQASDLALYMIGQGRGVTNDPLKRLMERLSSPTGGRALFTDKIDELQGAFSELLDEISNQYVLGYQPPKAAGDDAWHEIKVEVDGHARVRARQGYRRSPRTLRVGRAAGPRPAERHQDGSQADLVAVGERRRNGEALAAHERPVLAFQILDGGVRAGDANARVVSRDRRRFEPDGDVGVAAQQMLSVPEGNLPRLPDDPAAHAIVF